MEYTGQKPYITRVKMLFDCSESIVCLSYSPDGTRIVSGSAEGSIYVWGVTSGKLIKGPLHCESRVEFVSFSLDGSYVLSLSEDCMFRKWDIRANELINVTSMIKRYRDSYNLIEDSKESVTSWSTPETQIFTDSWKGSAVLSPCRELVVFGTDKGQICIWNVETRAVDSEPLRGHSDSVSSLSFSSDGRYLASGSEDTTVIVWDVRTKQIKTGPLIGHADSVLSLSLSIGNTIVSGSRDRTIRIWDTSTGDVLHVIDCMDDLHFVTYSPNGSLIVAGGEYWMNIWNVDDITASPRDLKVNGSLKCISFAPDNTRFASGLHRRIDLWEAKWGAIWEAIWKAKREAKRELNWEEKWDSWWYAKRDEDIRGFYIRKEHNSVAVSPSGKLIASESLNKSICLWDVASGKLVSKSEHDAHVASIVFSPIDERFIAFGLYDGTVNVWDTTSDEICTLGNHSRIVNSIDFSADGKYIASGSADKTIRTWDVRLREPAAGPLTGHTGSVFSVAYSTDGKTIASGSSDTTVRIWDSVTGLLSTLRGHSNIVSSVAYSYDGKRIVSGSNTTILVWDAQSGQIVCRLATKYHTVESVCFSPDGKQILSGYEDRTARIWDAFSGRLLFSPFEGYKGDVPHDDLLPPRSFYTVTYFPDGRRFATGSQERAIRIWSLDENPNDVAWRLKDDNWVVGENGELMMWIPPELRYHLCAFKNVKILNVPFYLKLHFKSET